MKTVPSQHKLERIITTDSDIPHARVGGHYEMLVEHPFDSTIKVRRLFVI